MLLLFSPSSFFLKREEEDKEEEETLEMIALCLLRFVRVRALVAVALVIKGGIDDDDNIFYLSRLSFVFVSPFARKERFLMRNTRDLNFLFLVFVSLSLFSFVGFAA